MIYHSSSEGLIVSPTKVSLPVRLFKRSVMSIFEGLTYDSSGKIAGSIVIAFDTTSHCMYTFRVIVRKVGLSSVVLFSVSCLGAVLIICMVSEGQCVRVIIECVHALRKVTLWYLIRA
jgi:hypothetical protein